MRNVKIHYYSKYKYTIILLIALMIISVSFGYLEGIITYLLKISKYNMSEIYLKPLYIEMLKEILILFIIIFLLQFTKGPFLRRTANFFYMISIKCIAYYSTLFILKGFNFNLFTLDIFFIIPIPFVAPVIAPIIISVLLIVAAFTIHIIYELIGIFKANWKMILCILLSTAAWIFSFINNSYDNHSYSLANWILFIFGILLFFIGYIYILVWNFSITIKHN